MAEDIITKFGKGKIGLWKDWILAIESFLLEGDKAVNFDKVESYIDLISGTWRDDPKRNVVAFSKLIYKIKLGFDGGEEHTTDAWTQSKKLLKKLSLRPGELQKRVKALATSCQKLISDFKNQSQKYEMLSKDLREAVVILKGLNFDSQDPSVGQKYASTMNQLIEKFKKLVALKIELKSVKTLFTSCLTQVEQLKSDFEEALANA